MPAERKEQIRKLPSGKWQLRYYDRKGARHSGGVFPSRARAHYRCPASNSSSASRMACNTWTAGVNGVLSASCAVQWPARSR